MRASYGFGRGFDVFAVRADMDVMDEADSELERGVEELGRWLAANGEQPFFAFFHTFEPHTPNCPRDALPVPAGRMRQASPGFQCSALSALTSDEPFGSLYEFVGIADDDVPAAQRSVVALSTADRALVSDLYDSAVAHVDLLLGRLIERLEESGLARRTVVVLTSDHGESLYERGHQGHFSLHDEALRVPLVLAAPGLESKRVPWQVRSVDVAPTLLELAGLPPASGLDGESLLPLARGAAGPHRDAWAYSPETFWGIGLRRRARVKYLLQDDLLFGMEGTERLFDLGGDPLEAVDLAATTELSGYRAEARRRLAAIPGVIVELSNPAAGGLRVELTGPAATAILTSRGEPGGKWVRVPSGLVVELPPGTLASSFLLQDPLPGRLDVRLGSGACPPHERSFERIPRGTVVGLACASGTWRAATPGDSSLPTVRLRWASEASMAEELEEQERLRREKELRALGYIQ
jgi:hypothetical protein